MAAVAVVPVVVIGIVHHLASAVAVVDRDLWRSRIVEHLVSVLTLPSYCNDSIVLLDDVKAVVRLFCV